MLSPVDGCAATCRLYTNIQICASRLLICLTRALQRDFFKDFYVYNVRVGTWGTAIFADDTAADVRDDYRDLVASGASDEDALAGLRKKYLDDSPDLREHIEPLFWLALAQTQWKLGRLDDTTKTSAIHIIDSGRDLENWRRLQASDTDLQKRARVLATLRQQLLSPQGRRLTIRPRRKRVSPYQVGDVLRFTLSSGRIVLFRITSLCEHRDGHDPVAEVLDYVGTTIPSEAELTNLPSRHRIKSSGFASIRFARILLPPFPKQGFDASRVAIVARGLPMPAKSAENHSTWPWPFLEQGLATDFGLQ